MFNDASSISKPYDLKCNVLLFVNYLSFSSVKVYQQILFLLDLSSSFMQVLFELLLIVDFPIIALGWLQQIAFHSV